MGGKKLGFSDDDYIVADLLHPESDYG